MGRKQDSRPKWGALVAVLSVSLSCSLAFGFWLKPPPTATELPRRQVHQPIIEMGGQARTVFDDFASLFFP